MPVRLTAPSRLVLVALLLVAVSGVDDPPPDAPSPGPGSSAPSASPKGAGVLRYALVEPVSIDPAFASDEAGLTVVDALFEPLTEIADDGTVEGAAAVDWEASEDARTFTFTLREARFHDGREVRADDFVRAFSRVVHGTADRRAAHPGLLADIEGFPAALSRGGPLEGVEALDRRTLRIRLRRPRADLPEVLSHPALAPVPPVVDRDPDAFAQRPVGNGPFRMGEPWEGGSEIHLVRNPEHPDAPEVGGVAFALYAGEDAERLAYGDLLAGEVDVAPSPGPDEHDDPLPPGEPTASPTPVGSPPRTTGGDLANVYVFGFVSDRPPFDDPALRRAFASSIDRSALVPADAEPAGTLLPPGVAGHGRATCDHCRYDRARAGLLTEGRAAPSVRLLVTEDPQAVSAARRVATDVTAATGMTVEVLSEPVADYLDRLDAGEADVFGLRFDARTATPDDLLYRYFASGNVGLTNLTRYASPEVDDLLARARATADRSVRSDLYRQVEQRVLDDAVVAPVWHGRVTYARDDAVRGLTFDPWGRPDLTQVELSP